MADQARFLEGEDATYRPCCLLTHNHSQHPTTLSPHLFSFIYSAFLLSVYLSSPVRFSTRRLPTTSSLFPMTVTSPVDVIALPDRDRSSHALATLAATPSFLRCHRRVQPKVSQRVPYASVCVCVCSYHPPSCILIVSSPSFLRCHRRVQPKSPYNFRPHSHTPVRTSRE